MNQHPQGYHSVELLAVIKRKPIGGLNSVLPQAQGRFLSILTLMMLGSLALVGLKVTSPNMEATANAYLTTAQTLDLAVMSNMVWIKQIKKN